MKMFGKFIFVMLLSVATLGSAQKQTMTVDPASSNVTFALTGTGHEVHGTFHVSQGTINFDRNSPGVSGSVVVSAASGESGEKSRDKKMHSDVLDVAHYADVTFEPAPLPPRATPTFRCPAYLRFTERHMTSPFQCRCTSTAQT
jgi:polyisoprenoid-binding protein YceI